MSRDQSVVTRDKRTLDPEVLERVRAVMTSHFAADTFHRVGIRDICKAARVSPKTLYKYFGSKEDLLLACVEQDLAELTAVSARVAEAHEGAYIAQLCAVAEAFFEFFATRQEVGRIIFLNVPAIYWVNQGSKGQTDYLALIYRALAMGQKTGEVVATPDAEALTVMLAGAANRLMGAWLIQSSDPEVIRARGRDYIAFFSESVRRRRA